MSNQITSLRERLYQWRQRRPVKRFFAAALFLIVFPVRFAILALLRVFSSDRQTRRILVVQMAGLGDTLILTPALAALQDQYPNARIDFITLHKYVSDAFKLHPRLTRVTALPCYPGAWVGAKFSRLQGARLLFATICYYPELLLRHSFTRYELSVNFGLGDFDRNVGNALLYCLNVPRRIGSNGPNATLLTDCAVVDTKRQHRAELYLSFLKPLGISSMRRDYEFPVVDKDLRAAQALLADCGIDASRPLALIQPGGKQLINSRRWPASYYERLCEFLSASEGFEVLVSGDANDREVCDEVGRNLSRVKNVAGKLTFAETAALLSISQLVVTNDTSTLHLANAVGVPRVISIFGPTDPDLLAPLNERNIVFRPNLPCAPCMGGLIDNHTERCSREIKEECLWQITPDQIINVLKPQYRQARIRVAGA